MAKEQFIDHKFNRASLELIETADNILNDYARQGYRLSLRQLYYQMVARDIIKNTVKSYKRIGNLVSDARLAGLLDWDRIEDRGRDAVIPAAWKSPAEIVRAAASQFRVDRWQGQPCHVEVMVEKDALSGILGPVCQELHVRFTANKGYSSSSAMYEAGRRMKDAKRIGKNVHIFYFGDHDPSGIDMTRDIDERLAQFARTTKIEVHRLALNWEQVEAWQPPENPAKETDSRFEAYRAEFGESSWELDAVEPRTLASLVRENIDELIEHDTWDEVMEEERRMRRELEDFATEYENREDGE